MGEKVLILYSGGSDSRLMRKIAIAQGLDPLLLFVDYGQTWDKIPNTGRVVSVSGLLLDFFKRYERVAPDYIPNRNMMLVALAGVIAEQEGIKRIWLGANWSDVLHSYPDCTPQWVKVASACLPSDIVVEAPLQFKTYKEIMREIDSYVS